MILSRGAVIWLKARTLWDIPLLEIFARHNGQVTDAKPHVTIRYCMQCNWLLRAQWFQGELLQTFAYELGGVTLEPGTGGVFTIDVEENRLWDRSVDGGFPDIVALKRAVRDLVAPDRVLGHADRKPDEDMRSLDTD